jgi:hypothetical protein
LAGILASEKALCPTSYKPSAPGAEDACGPGGDEIGRRSIAFDRCAERIDGCDWTRFLRSIDQTFSCPPRFEVKKTPPSAANAGEWLAV